MNAGYRRSLKVESRTAWIVLSGILKGYILRPDVEAGFAPVSYKVTFSRNTLAQSLYGYQNLFIICNAPDNLGSLTRKSGWQILQIALK